MQKVKNLPVPHPFPYQGSKRHLAKLILPHFPPDVECLIEPFCGAAAVSIAACARAMCETILLNDLNSPLISLWREILNRPDQLAKNYEDLWNEQQPDRKAFFFKIRDQFNLTHEPAHMLYLLARIVKGSLRYSSEGLFNQSADNRRSGMKPLKMKKNLIQVSQLLSGITELQSNDFLLAVKNASPKDLVYMDPPYQGTSFTRDHRYCKGLSYESFTCALAVMNKRDLSYIISYDGRTGDKSYGRDLPSSLNLRHLYLSAGRSTQATLLGKTDETVESLYLSPALVERLAETRLKATQPPILIQQKFAFA